MTTKRKAAKSATAAGKAAKRSAQATLSIATSKQRSVKERVAALAAAPLAVTENDKSLQAVLTVLRNKTEPVAGGLAALQSLAAAAFSGVTFASCRTDYISTFREGAGDSDPEIRKRVLGLLARGEGGLWPKKLPEW